MMSKVYIKDGQLCVPDRVTVPYIEGDGVGAEITPVCQRIVNAAVELAYLGKRSIEWKEVLAGGKAFQQRTAYHSGGRRHPFVECSTAADARPVCLPASGPLVSGSGFSCQGS